MAKKLFECKKQGNGLDEKLSKFCKKPKKVNKK